MPARLNMDSFELPSEIKVRINKEKGDKIFAELVDLGVFTEAENFLELIYNVNDLVYTYFDVPKIERDKVWYQPSFEHQSHQKPLQLPSINPILFHVLTRPESGFEFLK